MPQMTGLPSQVADWWLGLKTLTSRRLPTSQVLGLLKGPCPQTFCYPTLHANCSQISPAQRLTWPLYPCKTDIQEGQAAPSISGPSSHTGAELELGLEGRWGLLWILRSPFFSLPRQA